MKLLVGNEPTESQSGGIPPKRARRHCLKNLWSISAEEFGYTEAEFRGFQQLCQMYSAMTMDDLKDVCKRNGQIIKGTKKDLVFRCADGKLLGALPHCPNCGQGHMRFDSKYRFFFCPGHLTIYGMENCGMKIRPEDLIRTPWQD